MTRVRNWRLGSIWAGLLVAAIGHARCPSLLWRSWAGGHRGRLAADPWHLATSCNLQQGHAELPTQTTITVALRSSGPNASCLRGYLYLCARRAHALYAFRYTTEGWGLDQHESYSPHCVGDRERNIAHHPPLKYARTALLHRLFPIWPQAKYVLDKLVGGMTKDGKKVGRASAALPRRWVPA